MYNAFLTIRDVYFGPGNLSLTILVFEKTKDDTYVWYYICIHSLDHHFIAEEEGG